MAASRVRARSRDSWPRNPMRFFSASTSTASASSEPASMRRRSRASRPAPREDPCASCQSNSLAVPARQLLEDISPWSTNASGSVLRITRMEHSADFEQSDRPRAIPDVAIQCRDEPRKEAGAKKSLLFSQRISQTKGLVRQTRPFFLKRACWSGLRSSPKRTICCRTLVCKS